MIEIEAKFRVDQPAIFTALQQVTKIGPFTLIPTPGVEYQHSTYFDTPDRRLSAQHCSLRVRKLGQRRLGAFKRSLPTQAGIHTREEWQVELDAGEHPYDWPNSEARDQALGALCGAAVVPLVEVFTQRQYVYAIGAAVVLAEICLDEGSIAAGGWRTEFRELEVELVDSQARAEFDALLDLLRERYPLVPEMLGKKARGLALLDAAKLTSPERVRVPERAYQMYP